MMYRRRANFSGDDDGCQISRGINDGATVRGETNIGQVGSHIKKLKLEPETCLPMPESIAAIYEADIITVGPGSLFTSLLPPLLVKGVAEAIATSFATKIFVCNLMTQPGETEGVFGAETFGNRSQSRAGY